MATVRDTPGTTHLSHFLGRIVGRAMVNRTPGTPHLTFQASEGSSAPLSMKAMPAACAKEPREGER
jgi:hypothetical protein